MHVFDHIFNLEFNAIVHLQNIYCFKDILKIEFFWMALHFLQGVLKYIPCMSSNADYSCKTCEGYRTDLNEIN